MAIPRVPTDFHRRTCVESDNPPHLRLVEWGSLNSDVRPIASALAGNLGIPPVGIKN